MVLNTKMLVVIKKYESHPEFLGIKITDPNQPGAVGDTLLHLAARVGDLEAIEVLAESGAKVNFAGDLGNTPLHQAAMTGQAGSIKKLLELGADPGLKNDFDQTASEVADLGGHREISKILRNHKNIKN